MAPERAVRLHLRGKLQAVLEVGRVEVEDGEKILTLCDRGVGS